MEEKKDAEVKKQNAHSGCFDIPGTVKRLVEITKDLAHLNLVKFVEVCQSFTKLSGSLGYLVSWGFQDIHTKCRILKEHMDNYTKLTTMQQMVEYEMANNLHILSGSNNSKKGFDKAHSLGHYESASRTILRLIWFLSLVKELLKGLIDKPKDHLFSIGQTAYNNSIAPWHPFLLRNAIRLVFYTVPIKESFLKNAFGEINHAKFVAQASEIAAPLNKLVDFLWGYYKEKKLTGLE